jgi:hypothetical protein
MMTYKIKFTAIDGTETKSFKRLADVASYVQKRDLGEEWRRSEGLQCEFGFIRFLNFGWEHIRPEGSYVTAAPTLSFRKSKFKSHVTGLPLCIEAYVNGSEAAQIFERNKEAHGSDSFDVDFGFGDLYREGQPRWDRFPTLEAAKQAIKARLATPRVSA